MTIDDIFGATSDLNWMQECARAVLIFSAGLVLVRLAGRRVFSKWTALDITVSIMVGSSLSRALTGNAALWGTLIAVTLLMGLHRILSQASVRSAKLSQLFEGRSIRLAEDGDLNELCLRAHAVTRADLNEALRGAGLEDASDARLIVLEPSGKISVIKKH